MCSFVVFVRSNFVRNVSSRKLQRIWSIFSSLSTQWTISSQLNSPWNWNCFVRTTCNIRRVSTVRLAKMSGNLNSLPPEITLEILSFLDTKSLCQASQTCKKWREYIYNTDLLWKRKCSTLDQDEIEQDVQKGLWWRNIFIRNYGTNAIKRRWFEGKYRHVKSPDELPRNHFGPMSTETWGCILDVVQNLA